AAEHVHAGRLAGQTRRDGRVRGPGPPVRGRARLLQLQQPGPHHRLPLIRAGEPEKRDQIVNDMKEQETGRRFWYRGWRRRTALLAGMLAAALAATVGIATVSHAAFGSRWLSVSVGNEFGCAIRDDRTLWCWKNIGHHSQWGPTSVSPDNDWASVSVGTNH